MSQYFNKINLLPMNLQSINGWHRAKAACDILLQWKPPIPSDEEGVYTGSVYDPQ